MAKKGKTKVRVNFKGVDKEIRKRSDRSARVPEGDYLVKILEGEVRESERTGNSYINWKFQIVEPSKYKGKTIYGMTSLKSDALWNLRNLINAATGKNVAGKALDFDLEKVYGKVIGASIEDDEYNDKVRSRANSFFPKDEAELADDDEDSDDEDEESDDEEDDDEDEDEDEESDDDDLEDVEVEEL